jgi:glycosyltransferase involved in cell wall biosynthesis
MTAASDGIGFAYSGKYDLPRPATVLNVFPLETVNGAVATEADNPRPLSIYWYSQVIGPGRGLEEAVRALSLLQRPCELHLRGAFHGDYGVRLTRLANELGVANRLFLHPPCAPDELVGVAMPHDVGLALEVDIELNRLICVTNKIFTYMNAGLAIVATNTPAQQSIMAQVRDAGVICRMNDPQSLADAINELSSTPERLIAAKQAARRAAVERFNWDVESRTLVNGYAGAEHAPAPHVAATVI